MRRNALIVAAVMTAPWAVTAAAARAQGLPAAQPEEIGLLPAALDRIAPALQAYVDSGKLAGMVALIARHGKVGYAQAVGYADLETRTPMRLDNVFRMYSMTKPIIAAAILKLAEQGRLRLDDPVTMYVPAFSSTKVYAGGGSRDPELRDPDRSIRIEHLLSHTAGLTYGAFGQTPVDSIYRLANLLDPSRTVQQFADSIARLPLLFSPGNAWNYSMAFDVLGAVIEVAANRPLDVYLAEEIFLPLGMLETAFRVTPVMEGRIPVLYSRGPNNGLRAAGQLIAAVYHPGSALLSGGGGLLSTPADYLRFVQMILNRGELDGRRILSSESVELMTRNHLPPALTPIESPMVGHSGYGHGLGGAVLVDSARAALPGSTGIFRWWGLMGTFFWVDPRTDLVGMVWTQFSTGRVYPLEQEFQRLAYAAVQR
jgi:CubicO group peptidase (beta-lactamase class C family)